MLKNGLYYLYALIAVVVYLLTQDALWAILVGVGSSVLTGVMILLILLLMPNERPNWWKEDKADRYFKKEIYNKKFIK